jgi:hypothetical protein
VVAGEKELNHHDVALSATMHALLSAPGSVGVLSFVGVSRKALKQAVAQLSLAGLDTRVTVIAATGLLAFLKCFAMVFGSISHILCAQRKNR